MQAYIIHSPRHQTISRFFPKSLELHHYNGRKTIKVKFSSIEELRLKYAACKAYAASGVATTPKKEATPRATPKKKRAPKKRSTK